MSENDYSIKPLLKLPNVTGLNPPKDGEDRNKRQSSQKRSNESQQPEEEQINVIQEDEYAPVVPTNEDPEHIDYRA